MGYGKYSRTDTTTRTSGRLKKTSQQIFTARGLNSDMDPMNFGIRESRDSEEHPNSIPIMIWIDLTGSMDRIPAQLAKGHLNTIIATLQDADIHDAQVFFGGVGDHIYDTSPLQIGQFESSDELLDHSLTNLYIEGCGGPFGMESYALAWLVGARHTAHDAMEKRGIKGYLFTIGDEDTHPILQAKYLKRILGYDSNVDLNASDLLKEAQELYHVYHIHARREEIPGPGHIQLLLGQNCLRVKKSYKEIPQIIANTVLQQLTVDEVFASPKAAAPA